MDDVQDVAMLEKQLQELENSLWHLKRSNFEMREFLAEDPEDQVCFSPHPRTQQNNTTTTTTNYNNENNN